MPSWLRQLPHDPLSILLDSGVEPVAFFARRDLLGENPGPLTRLWESHDAQMILRRQQGNGRWKYPAPGATDRSVEDYDQIETYRQVGFLVEKYGFSRKHPALRNAAEFLFTRQTKAGDFRGIYGRQYSPNYSAGIMELLIKAGYGRDPRIERGLRWLLSMRQSDGGWAIPLRTAGVRRYTEALARGKTLEPDRAKPYSHLATGVVLRAFAVSGRYRNRPAIQSAGRLLAARLFKADTCVDRKAASFWTGFRYPFWFTDLITALDSLSRLGFSADDENIRKGLDWFVKRQRKDGGWTLKLLSGADKNLPLWLDLSVCRIFKRFYQI
jgi:squalene cyclase